MTFSLQSSNHLSNKVQFNQNDHCLGISQAKSGQFPLQSVSDVPRRYRTDQSTSCALRARITTQSLCMLPVPGSCTSRSDGRASSKESSNCGVISFPEIKRCKNRRRRFGKQWVQTRMTKLTNVCGWRGTRPALIVSDVTLSNAAEPQANRTAEYLQRQPNCAAGCEQTILA